MLKIIAGLNVFLSATAFAGNVFYGDFDVATSYACMGYDNLPIGNDSDLASTCCDGGGHLRSDAPDSCRTGFTSLIAQSAYQATVAVNLANNALSVSSGLDGANMDGSSLTNLGSQGAGYQPGEGSASINGGSAGGYGSGPGKAGKANSGNSHAGGAGAGAGGAGGGSGLGLGTSGGTTGLNGDPNDPNNQKANGGKYSKVGDGKGAGSGGGRFAGFGGLDGAGAGGNGGAGGGPNELAFGDDASGGANGAGGEDGDGKGSAEDPSDYFNRIDKSADIFKIVSARYMKKKSLWMIPQKLPEDLKEKKI